MSKKLAILVLIVFVVIASMQMSYAQEDYADIIGYETYDNEFEAGVADPKDVGTVSASINNGGNLIISVYNAYPGYVAYVNFTIKNVNSELSIYLDEIVIVNDNASKMNVAVTDLSNNPIPLDTELLPGETMECLVTITMLPAADQDQSYLFSVDLNFGDGLI